MAAPPFKVKALFEYASPEDDDLNFPNGQIITVTEEEDDDWYNGEYVDEQGTKRQGIFPKNFVERFEPETPPRPARSNRPKKAAEPELPGSAVAVRSEAPAAPVLHGTEVEDEDAGDHGTSAPPQAPSQGAEKAETAIPSPRPPVIKEQAREQPALAPQPSPKPEQHTQAKAPPPVAEKPATGSFRDRIAAFNKPTAPPVAPFKPGGLGSGGSGFIKKPFVAPPPSKNAYVPPPREAPQKIYRREEDPDLVERTSEDAGPIERPIVPVAAAEGDEDQPKPTSLKERIALLQKQQQEQAVRHAEVAQKKEKAKRPPKKRVDSSEPAGDFEEGAQTPELERVDTAETVGKRSLDIGQNGVDVSAKQKSSADPYQPASANAGPQDIPSDANDADQSGGGETTEDADETSTGIDETEEKPRSKAPAPPIRARSHRAPEAAVAAGDEQTRAETVPTQGDDNAEEEEAEEEEDEDIDPEARRRLEIRERMAKMSGGMGMHGMFGPPGGMPPPAAHAGAKRAKASGSRERSAREHTDESNEAPVSPSHAPPVPVMPMPGRPPVKGREETAKQAVAEKAKELPAAAAISARDPEEVPDVEEVAKDEMVPPSSVPRSAPPPAPRDRPVPPPPTHAEQDIAAHAGQRPMPRPPAARPAPPPPPEMPLSPSAGSESDDESSIRPKRLSLNTSAIIEPGAPSTTTPTPLSGTPRVPTRPGAPPPALTQDISAAHASPTSPTIPGPHTGRPGRTAPTSEASPTTPSTSTMRSPPPPPPTGIPQHKSLSRTSTGDTKPLRHPKQPAPDESEEEVTEYEGDYDTDIASGATHKDALKARVREGSPDGSTTIDDTPLASPSVAPPSLPPPVPSSTAPRGIPPPPRGQPPRTGRPSAEVPRAAPPPVPPPREQIAEDDGLEYDPFRYTGPSHGVPTSDHQLGPTVNAPPPDRYEEDNPYSGSSRQGRPSQPPRQGSSHRADDGSPSASSPRTLAPQPSVRAPPRQSLDMPKTPGLPRRSTDQARPSGEYGFIAADVDLGATSHWWTQPNMPPPVFQNRRDVLYEVEESSTSKRGGKTTISKDVYVLFQDYSQTVVTARFDSKDVAEVSLEQRHEAPPQRLRQDQLEDAHARFGQRISDGAVAKQNTSVGDGSPQALVMDLLQPLSDALMPVAGRAYGALVYANLANASVQQHDEIRAGDIMTLRNAKFQGHKGPMHQKYSAEVGKPDHVGVVVDWDGTKKKVRVWEQGRESRKVKMESFKVGDLRSGEVKIWRVMARSWVGWEGQN